MYIEVVFNLPIDKSFYYLLPKELISDAVVGKRILAPFGYSQLKGYIVDIVANKPLGDYEIKSIEKIIDPYPIFNAEMLALAKWVSEYWMSPLGQVLSNIHPPQMNLSSRRRKASPLPVFTSFPEEKEVLSFQLTIHQREILESVETYVNEHKFGVFLLHGITGSGKTEVYLRAISNIVGRGESVIVLVPEISLTPQTIERFNARFPQKIAVLHSKLSATQRRDQWERIQNGTAQVVIGARSAVFAPVPELGMIIVDEEHETSYKQYDTAPRYNARDVAVIRAKLTSAVVILGSATPSLESYYNAQRKKYHYIELPSRIEDRKLPVVKIVDMRKEGFVPNPIFSMMLKQAINHRLMKNEQTILFLNRRGFSTFIQCKGCGNVSRCPNCDISLTYHKAEKIFLRCHYCDYQIEAFSHCPECLGTNIRLAGFGTQQVEHELLRLFPQARILRMDTDTTRKKGKYVEMLNDYKSGEIDILIGTQMIAKGLDFPTVTLVGIISADVSLYLPDFRAAEHTFSLLTQVAGRAGRGTTPGEVILQTYSPEHYSIQTAAKHIYNRFYLKEYAYRQFLNYPPFTHLINIVGMSKNEDILQATMEELALQLNAIKSEGIIVLGPAPCALRRLKKKYRWQILLKGIIPHQLRSVVKGALANIAIPSTCILNIDVDPIGML